METQSPPTHDGTRPPFSPLLFFCLCFLLALVACDERTPVQPLAPDDTSAATSPSSTEVAWGGGGVLNAGAAARGTGSIEIVWNGGNSPAAGDTTVPARQAFAEFDLHEAYGDRPARGNFVFRVASVDGPPHRTVTVAADGVVVEPGPRRLWFLGTVISDTKGCDGGPGGGHDEGCGDTGGGCGEDEGGCSGHDGGCSDDHSTDEGGGCTGGHEDGATGGGHGASGRTCRVGQRLVGKMHDGGTPGVDGDGITWRWYLADDPAVPSLDDLATWPHLCRKQILGGNLTVFVSPRTRPSLQSSD